MGPAPTRSQVQNQKYQKYGGKYENFCDRPIESSKTSYFKIDFSIKDNSCESEKSSENPEAPLTEHQVFKAVFHDIMFQNSKPDEEAIGKANI